MALIGDRERERAANQLTEHYLQGRLSLDELTQRLELALSARRHTDVRRAFADLPASWRQQVAGARSGLDSMWRGVCHAALVLAVWVLWAAVSFALLVGFIVSVLVQGLSLSNGLLFPALWLGSTAVARHVTRRPSA
jgi:Domain of unknown function (DUF1707)